MIRTRTFIYDNLTTSNNYFYRGSNFGAAGYVRWPFFWGCFIAKISCRATARCYPGTRIKGCTSRHKLLRLGYGFSKGNLPFFQHFSKNHVPPCPSSDYGGIIFWRPKCLTTETTTSGKKFPNLKTWGLFSLPGSKIPLFST